MSIATRRRTVDRVALLAGNLLAWAPLACAAALAPRPTDPVHAVLIYFGVGIPVILLLTLVAEVPLLARVRGRSAPIFEWVAIAAGGVGLALPGAVIFGVIGLATGPGWAGVGAAAGAVAFSIAGVFVGLLGRVLYPLLARWRPVAWIVLSATAALFAAAGAVLVAAHL